MTFILIVALGAIAMLVELVRRGRREQLLLANEERRYRDFAFAGANILWELDADLRLTALSVGGEARRYSDIRIGDSLETLQEKLSALQLDSVKLEQLLHSRAAIDQLEISVKTGGSLRIFALNGIPVTSISGKFLGYRGIIRESTDKVRLTEALAYRASYDHLTGLLNRYEFEKRLTQLCLLAEQEPNMQAMIYIDMDQFKVVNDTVGHVAGDALLKHFSSVVQKTLPANSDFGRLGGDEFGVLLSDCPPEQARATAENILAAIKQTKFKWDDRTFAVKASIGVVAIGEHNAQPVDVLCQADMACYRAKELGRNRIQVIQELGREMQDRQLNLERMANISQAIDENRLSLVRQPIVTTIVADETTQRHELLLRIRDRQGKSIPPGILLPIAEQYGAASDIDTWVLSTALANFDEYAGAGSLSINLSGSSINDDRFLATATRLIADSGVDPKRICIEITETAAIENLDVALVFMKRLKKLGVQFALDDFGAGVSSFGYLRDLPVDLLKIDGTLVSRIASDETYRVMVRAINEVAHAVGIKTVAEFVETEEVRDILLELGVDYVQGFLIGKPESLEMDSNRSDTSVFGRPST